MGLFAYGHPFLDGNGRTMLIVHIELAHRSGFSICWDQADKSSYLSMLSKKIESPGKGMLDEYLIQFKNSSLNRNEWADIVLSINGLDGMTHEIQIYGDFSDGEVSERYRQFEKKRGYRYVQTAQNKDDRPAIQAKATGLMKPSRQNQLAKTPAMPDDQDTTKRMPLKPEQPSPIKPTHIQHNLFNVLEYIASGIHRRTAGLDASFSRDWLRHATSAQAHQ